MAIDPTIHAIVMHLFDLCPNLTIQGTNNNIMVRYAGDEVFWERNDLGALTLDAHLMILEFEGSMLITNIPNATRRKLSRYGIEIPDSFDLNREEDLELLEKTLKMISNKLM